MIFQSWNGGKHYLNYYKKWHHSIRLSKVMKKKMINMYLLSKIIGRTQSIFILMKVKSDD